MPSSPGNSPPCSPPLVSRSRANSVTSEFEVDVRDADLQLHTWGDRLLAGARSCPNLQSLWDAPGTDDESEDLNESCANTLLTSKSNHEGLTAEATVLRHRLARSPIASITSIPEEPESSGKVHMELETVKEAHCCDSTIADTNSIQGSVTLRGSIEGSPESLCDILCEALVEVLAEPAGRDVSVFVSLGAQAEIPESPGLKDLHLFDFKANIPDANDLSSATEVLNLEAACGGARRLLPLMADSQALDGHLAVRLHVHRVGGSLWQETLFCENGMWLTRTDPVFQ